MSLLTPISAQSLRDMIGVNTRVTYGTEYWKWDKVLAALKDIGIVRVRDGIYYSYPTFKGGESEATKAAMVKSNMDWNAVIWSRQEAMGKAGIKLLGGSGAGEFAKTRNLAQLDRVLSVAAGRLRPYLVGLEGANEYDISGDSNWVANLRYSQQTVYQKVKANPALAALPVVGPSFASNAAATACGDLSSVLDRGNLHCYQGGVPETAAHLTQEKNNKAAVSKDKPLVPTEWGYHNALKGGTDHPPTSEKAAATYLLSALLEHRKFGFTLSCQFQLLDDVADSTLTLSYRHFGIVRPDWTYKPAAKALKNLIALLGIDGTPALTPLDITISNPTMRSLVMRRADGAYLVVLWRGVQVWDRVARKDIAVVPVAVQVKLPSAKTVEVSLPVTSPEVHPTGFSNGLLSTCVGGDPVVLVTR